MKHLIGLITGKYAYADGCILPPRKHRWGGSLRRKNNQFYLQSADKKANRLIRILGCNAKTKILDIGCGQGRLAIGLIRALGSSDYIGIDPHKPSIDWCKKYIEANNPQFKFHHINVHNERYSQTGKIISDDYHFDIESNSIDIIYLYSVFTHMKQEEMRIYLKDFKRILRKNGKVFFSAFYADDVEDYSINPDGFPFTISGPMHVVRYNKEYLFSIITELGYDILDIDDVAIEKPGGQKFVYLAVKDR